MADGAHLCLLQSVVCVIIQDNEDITQDAAVAVKIKPESCQFAISLFFAMIGWHAVQSKIQMCSLSRGALKPPAQIALAND